MAQTEIEIARDSLEAAKLNYAAAQLNRRTAGITNEYDVVESTSEKYRRKCKVETASETELLGNLKRHKGINLTRNLERNYSTAAGHLRQFKLNVVGANGPKLSLLTDDKDGNAAANTLFNSVWAKSPSAIDDTHLAEIVANVLTSVKREGDVIVVFDDFDYDDAKLIFYEADQLTNLSADDWKRQTLFPADQFVQADGVIKDRRGTVRGWVVGPRGQYLCKLEDVSILKRDRPEDPGIARMIHAPKRLTQDRGVAEMLTPAAEYQDAREILAKEMQSAKVASSLAGVVTRKDGAGGEAALLTSGIDPDAIIDGAATTVVTGAPAENYDRMESLTGGYMEYLADGDDFKILDFNRPNVNTQVFLGHTTQASGAALGLSKSYATMTPAGSYTAFRGDMLLAWAQFYWDQKFLERRLMDWLGFKVFTWAMRRRKLRRLPAAWQTKMKWDWPVMPQIDPVKTELAIRQALANGTTDYEKELGPDWRAKFKALADQLAYANELGLLLNRDVTERDADLINTLQQTDTQE